MKDLKEQIIEAVQDATDTVDGTVSIPILDHFLDGILSEQLHQPPVSGLLIAWEKFKKDNWYESDAVDVEKMLMDKFQAIYNR